MSVGAGIKCFGLFWRLDRVRMDKNTEFWMQGWLPKSNSSYETSKTQRYTINRLSGIYALQNDRREILYIGQTADLGNRLWQHTRNDNRDKWSHFSWFSISEATPDTEDESADISSGNATDKGNAEVPLALDQFEAILIELIAPRLNKRGGHWTKAKKFLQTSQFRKPSTHDLYMQNQELLERMKALND